MLSEMMNELAGRGAATVAGMIIGASTAWFLARWRRYQDRRSILKGDARDTVVVEHHLVNMQVAPDGRPLAGVLRIRSLGQAQLSHVVPNGHLAKELLERAWQVTPSHTLISMNGAEGSYLLETLTNFVCDRVAGAVAEHDVYVMAPCCEPAGLAVHQPIVVILISAADLALFETWEGCRDVRVEHGSDGARVLSLMELAQRFRDEQQLIQARRAQGQRTTYMESSYLLDLAIDKGAAPRPVKPVPWQRFKSVLDEMHLHIESTARQRSHTGERRVYCKAN